MDNLKKIIEILDKYEECKDNGLNVIVTDYGQKNELAQDLVKLFAIPVVSDNEERVAAADNDNGWITPTKEDIAAQHENYDPC